VYRDPFDLIHRDQTHLVEKRVQEKWRGRVTEQQASCPPSSIRVKESASRDAQIAQLVPAFELQMITEPQLSFHQLALPRFVFDFGASPDASKTGALAMLPRVHSRSAPESFFNAAVTAVSLINFAARFKSAEAREAAITYYVKALRQFAVATENPRTVHSSEALLSVFLLALYEVRG
jgi:hypothetical protein